MVKGKEQPYALPKCGWGSVSPFIRPLIP